MDLEQHIKLLCRNIISCKSDEEAIGLVRELKPLLERRVAELRAISDGAPVRNTPGQEPQGHRLTENQKNSPI
jgi:hypothetical protein